MFRRAIAASSDAQPQDRGAAFEMVEPTAADDCPFIAGDGDYSLEIVGVLSFQDALEWLARGRTETPTDYSCTALLIPDPDHGDDSDAISVTIEGRLVGYLPADAAERMHIAMLAWDFEYASCDALVRGGWYRSKDDKGDFQVCLDVNHDFTPAVPLLDLVPVDLAPAAASSLPVPVDVVAPRRKTLISGREIFVSACGTAIVFALAMAAWLVLPLALSSSDDEQAFVAPSSQVAENRSQRIEAEKRSPRAEADWRSLPAAAGAAAVLRALSERAEAIRPVSSRAEIRTAIQAPESRPDTPSPAMLSAAPAARRGEPISRTIEAVLPSPVGSTAKVVPVEPLRTPPTAAIAPPLLRAVSERNATTPEQSTEAIEQDAKLASPKAASLIPAAKPVFDDVRPVPVTTAIRGEEKEEKVQPERPRTREDRATRDDGERSEPERSRAATHSRSHRARHQIESRRDREESRHSRERSSPSHSHRFRHRIAPREREAAAERRQIVRDRDLPPQPSPQAGQLRRGETMASRMMRGAMTEWQQPAKPTVVWRWYWRRVPRQSQSQQQFQQPLRH
jgi:hypothetical protein